METMPSLDEVSLPKGKKKYVPRKTRNPVMEEALKASLENPKSVRGSLYWRINRFLTGRGGNPK